MGYKFNVFTGTLDITGSGSSGGVSGVPPTTIDAIARWADTAGTLIKDSPGTFIQDSGAIEASGFIGNRSVTDVLTVPSDYYMITSGLELEVTGSIELEVDSELIIL